MAKTAAGLVKFAKLGVVFVLVTVKPQSEPTRFEFSVLGVVPVDIGCYMYLHEGQV